MTQSIRFLIALLLMIPMPEVGFASPGDKFREVIASLKDENLKLTIETKAKEAGDSEAKLIRLLGEVLQQCGWRDSCEFRINQQITEWSEVIPFLERFLERGQFDAMGWLFRCAVEHLEGAEEGEYRDCLKQAELVVFRKAHL